MKKLLLIINFLFTILFLTSCSGHFFNPRYYYNKNGSQESEQTPPPDIDIGGGDINIDPNEDPFKVGEWNDIGYQFDGNKILDFLFAASFDGKNVPVYTFFKDGTQWTLSDASMAENKYNAKDGANKAQGYDITGGSFYRYDYKNPLVAAESAYNQSDRMERFLFYRIVGKAVIVPLNNYLIAVDKYSKLVFAYGKITKTGSAMGQAYPTAFEAVELHGDKRPFYEYDPIGFMSYDETQDKMTLTLYREYQEEMAMDANAFFPKIHDSSRAIASYKDKESAGRSPYYYVNVADIDPETILTEFKGKTYAIRSGLTLYTYKFSADGKEITITLDHFYDGQTLKETHSYVKVVGATSLQYGNLTITGLENYVKIKDSLRNLNAELDYVDPGPDFIYRVRGKTFKSEDGTSYKSVFSANGKILTYYKNDKVDSTYVFAEQDASDRAVYQQENASTIFSFWGLRLANTKGTKDDTLYWSVGAGSSAGGTKTDGITSKPGYIDVSTMPGGFTKNVRGKTFFYRNYDGNPGDGASLNSYTYIFDGEGTSFRYLEKKYKGEASIDKTYTLDREEGTVGYYVCNGETVKLSITGNSLYKDDQPAGDTGLIDRGPYFLDIVRGTKYISPDKTYMYEFSDDGKRLTYTYPSGKTQSYEYQQMKADDYNIAAYWEEGAWVFGYWALRLSQEGVKIEMSTSAVASATDIFNMAAYGYPAYIGDGSVSGIDIFMSTVAGRVYEVRNSTDSLLLNRYTFSDAGNYIIYQEIDWYTDEVKKEVRYEKYEKIDSSSGKYNGVVFSLNSDKSELKNAGTLAGYYQYKDPGPDFVDRVKGKTYVKSDGKGKYVFSSDGLILTDYDSSGKKIEDYRFASVDYEPVGSDNITGERAIYERPDRPWYEAALPYWGLKLVTEDGKKDYKLYWTGSAWGGTGTTPAENADEFESIRED